MMNFNKHQSTIYCVLLGIIIGALFIFGAQMDGSFSWADSPRHALNGAFIMDLFKDLQLMILLVMLTIIIHNFQP